MKSNDILYSKGANDECYTPRYVVEHIIEYLPKDKVIWCPFDKDSHAFPTVLRKYGYSVVNSHIDYGQDFYTYEPEYWDIIASNPPFTNKRKIFERALSFNKPFMLLMANTWLNDSAPIQLFRNRDLQLLMFDKRINFFMRDRKGNNLRPTFSSSFYCVDILPKQIIMKNLNDNINQQKLF